MKTSSNFCMRLLGFGLFAVICLARAQNTVPAGVQAVAVTVTPFESSFVGAYRQGSVDVASELVLFEDKTFCYSVAAGALDQIMTGRWNETLVPVAKAPGVMKRISIVEVRPPNLPAYPVVGSMLKRLNGKTEIVFDGRTLSEAYAPVFAISNVDTLPTTFKPLFSDSMNSWAASYFYPQIPTEQAKYLYIGDMRADANGQRNMLHVVQYKLDPKFDTFRVYFDMATATPPLNVSLNFEDGVLFMNKSRWGVKKVQTQKWMTDAKANCAAAVSNRSSDTDADGKKQTPLNLAIPVKTYQFDKKVMVGQPIFDKTYDSAKYAYDSDEEAAKQEKDALTAAFEKAKSDATQADSFLVLTKKIIDNNARIKKHALQLVDAYAQLINTMSGRGDFKSSTKVFFHFVLQILPTLLTQVDNLEQEEKEQALYRISVIASQSLTAAIATKNTAMSQLIFEKILTPKFDITTHKNATLIYNLACFYAINHKKTEMLEAVKQARKRGKPVKQFMDDTDFKDYLKDEEFLSAVK